MSDRTYLESAYKLKLNPFANRVDPNVDMVGRVKEKEQWTSIIESRKGTNGNTMCFVTGDYGFGKTLALYKIVKQYETNPEILPIFIKMLPEDKVSKFGVDFIQRIFRRIPKEVYEAFSLSDLDALAINYPEPSKVFRRIVLKDDKCIDFIRGERQFTETELRKMGLKRKMNKTDTAMEFLLCFLFLLKGTGKKTLLITVDETEYIFSQMSAGPIIASVFNTLREIYDLGSLQSMAPVPTQPANMIFFFAISSSGWEQMTNLGKREASKPGPVQPFLRRIESEQIQLLPLSVQETETLIEKRLKQNRTSGKLEDKPLIPFDKSFVKYIYELSNGGNPSEVLRYCDAALEEGIIQKATILNKAFAERAFAAHGLIVDTNV